MKGQNVQLIWSWKSIQCASTVATTNLQTTACLKETLNNQKLFQLIVFCNLLIVVFAFNYALFIPQTSVSEMTKCSDSVGKEPQTFIFRSFTLSTSARSLAGPSHMSPSRNSFKRITMLFLQCRLRTYNPASNSFTAIIIFMIDSAIIILVLFIADKNQRTCIISHVHRWWNSDVFLPILCSIGYSYNVFRRRERLTIWSLG